MSLWNQVWHIKTYQQKYTRPMEIRQYNTSVTYQNLSAEKYKTNGNPTIPSERKVPKTIRSTIQDGFWDFSLTRYYLKVGLSSFFFHWSLYFSTDRFWYVTLDSTTTEFLPNNGMIHILNLPCRFFLRSDMGCFASVLFLVIEHRTHSWNWNCHFWLWRFKITPVPKMRYRKLKIKKNYQTVLSDQTDQINIPTG